MNPDKPRILDICFGYTLGVMMTIVIAQYGEKKRSFITDYLTTSLTQINSSQEGTDLVINVGNKLSGSASLSGLETHEVDNDMCKSHLLKTDDPTTADQIQKKVRVLCWIMTCPERLKTRAQTVKDTWGKRCDILLFASDIFNKTFPTLNITVKHGRAYLAEKTRMVFNYIYENHINDVDWFLKADDDTYVMMENLRYFLSMQNTSQALFFGSHFIWESKIGFMSGGAGYVISKEALRRYGYLQKNLCFRNHRYEDVEWSKCMHLLGVKFVHPRDHLNRTLFHCFNPNYMIKGGFPKFAFSLKGGIKKVCFREGPKKVFCFLS